MEHQIAVEYKVKDKRFGNTLVAGESVGMEPLCAKTTQAQDKLPDANAGASFSISMSPKEGGLEPSV